MAMSGTAAEAIDPHDSFEAYEPTAEHYRTAAGWLLRLREAGDATTPAFKRWRDADPAHLFAFAETEAMFAASAAPSRAVGPYVPRQRRHQLLRRFGKIASAAIAVSLLLFLAVGQMDRIMAIGSDASALAGERVRFAMADGSNITLNTRTAIDTDTDAEFRGVRLRRGEAYFEVARDPDRPFTVRAGDASIRVLGTKFNVRIDDVGRTIVSVVGGHVRVASTKNPARTADLVLGQEAVISGDKVQKRAADLFVIEGWRRGEAVFMRAPLEKVVAELNRYRDHSIYILNRDLTDDRITGVFPTKDPRRAARMIETTLGVEAITLPTGQMVLY